MGWQGKRLGPLVGHLNEIRGKVKPSEGIFPTTSAVLPDWLGGLRPVRERWWGDCYQLYPSLGPLLGEEEKGFSLKTHALPYPSDQP